METSQIIVYIVQTVLTLTVGLIAWSIKSAIHDIKAAIAKNSTDIEKVKKEVSDLKSDLPLVYVLREDFIRTMNNVDKQMGDISSKLDKILHSKREV